MFLFFIILQKIVLMHIMLTKYIVYDLCSFSQEINLHKGEH